MPLLEPVTTATLPERSKSGDAMRFPPNQRRCVGRTIAQHATQGASSAIVAPMPPPSRRRVMAAGTIGNVLEWYDFSIYGFFAAAYGRTSALTFSVVAMALPTFLVGILPGYQTLGLAAPVLLTLLRMIQGLSVGGEYTTYIVFMVEHARPDQRGVI